VAVLVKTGGWEKREEKGQEGSRWSLMGRPGERRGKKETSSSRKASQLGGPGEKKGPCGRHSQVVSERGPCPMCPLNPHGDSKGSKIVDRRILSRGEKGGVPSTQKSAGGIMGKRGGRERAVSGVWKLCRGEGEALNATEKGNRKRRNFPIRRAARCGKNPRGGGGKPSRCGRGTSKGGEHGRLFQVSRRLDEVKKSLASQKENP